jgi:hypothetical protein
VWGLDCDLLADENLQSPRRVMEGVAFGHTESVCIRVRKQ